MSTISIMKCYPYGGSNMDLPGSRSTITSLAHRSKSVKLVVLINLPTARSPQPQLLCYAITSDRVVLETSNLHLLGKKIWGVD